MTTFKLSITHYKYPLPLRMLILFFDEYMVHVHCQYERVDSYNDSISTFYANICISHCIFIVSFFFPFCSVFRSLSQKYDRTHQ